MMNDESYNKQPDARMVNRRRTIETFIWLLIIVGLVLLVLNSMGMVKLFALQNKLAAITLTVIGGGLLFAALGSTIQNSRLRKAIDRMSRQQQRKFAVTFGNEAEVKEEDRADPAWKEKVRFSAVLEERQRLARELHDAVSQQLFAISMTATAVSRTIDRDFERAKRQVQLIEEMAAIAQSEMRALLLHLRPVHLDGKNFGQALHELIAEMQEKVPMEIIADIDETIIVPVKTEDHLFRIAQEALSNTLRHAKADAMTIRFCKKEQAILLSLEDNGVGFDLEGKKQASYGLMTMEERVLDLGGRLEIASTPGNGTKVHIYLQLNE